MMFERFSTSARQVLVIAEQEARGFGHDFIGTEHLLLGVVSQEDQWAALLLGRRGLTAQRVRVEIERIIGRGTGTEIDPGIDPAALATLGIDVDEVRRRVEATFGPGALASQQPCRRGRMTGRVPFTARAKKALELALREALEQHHDQVAPQHIALGLLHANGVGGHILAEHGVEPAALRSPLLHRPDDLAG
jgi:ATP-dependent Clp protease ATP-binding subunit ClpA